MPQTSSPWRINDVAAYDHLREIAVNAFAMLGDAADAEGQHAHASREEIARLRREVLTVDAYDRAAVVALTGRVQDWIREFGGRAS